MLLRQFLAIAKKSKPLRYKYAILPDTAHNEYLMFSVQEYAPVPVQITYAVYHGKFVATNTDIRAFAVNFDTVVFLISDTQEFNKTHYG